MLLRYNTTIPIQIQTLRIPARSLPDRRGDACQDVQLMRDVRERTPLYLGVALRHPAAQTLCVQLGVPGERRADGMDDVVQEIFLIGRVAVGASENHPVGTTGSEHIHPSRAEMGKQPPPGATVSRRFAVP